MIKPILLISVLILPTLGLAQSANFAGARAEIKLESVSNPIGKNNNQPMLKLSGSVVRSAVINKKNYITGGKLGGLIYPINHLSDAKTRILPVVGGDLVNITPHTSENKKLFVGAAIKQPYSIQNLMINPGSEFVDNQNEKTKDLSHRKLKGRVQSLQYLAEKNIGRGFSIAGSAEFGIIDGLAFGAAASETSESYIDVRDYPNSGWGCVPYNGPQNITSATEVTTYTRVQGNDCLYLKRTTLLTSPATEMAQKGKILKLNLGIEKRLGQNFYVRPEASYVAGDYSIKETYLGGETKTTDYKIKGFSPSLTVGVRFN